MSRVSLYDVLKEIGFRPISDSGLEFDFGNFKLQAFEEVNKYLAEIFYFSGINQTTRTSGIIEFDLPTKIESVEQGIAFLSYYLGRQFDAKIIPAWYHQGLLWKHHLPWEKKWAAYNQKPSAFIEHEYFRLMIRRMRKLALLANEGDITTFSFDGEIVRIVCAGEKMVASGTGNSWEGTVSVRTKLLTNLPERVKSGYGSIFLWEEKLHIDSTAFILINLPSSDVL